MHIPSASALAAFLAAALALPARAQTTDAPPGARPTASSAPWSVFSVRFDTRTSNFIYAVYGYGRTFAMVGALDNPRSGYTELLGGLGRTFSIGSNRSQFAAIAGARADTSWYAQVYFLPALRAGRVWVRATSELDVPVANGGSLQFALSPISGTMSVAKYVEAGIGADVAMSRGDRTDSDIGPELRFALPKATLAVDAQHSLNRSRARLRLSFVAAF